MKRIDLENTVSEYTPEILPLMAKAINEIMDYLEQIHKKDEMIKEIENEKN